MNDPLWIYTKAGQFPVYLHLHVSVDVPLEAAYIFGDDEGIPPG